MSRKCDVMEMNGNRCRREAIYAAPYHGEHELYGSLSGPDAPTWVRVEVCERHMKCMFVEEKKWRRLSGGVR